MNFKQRLELVQEYKEWVKEQNTKHDFNLCDNHETFLAFLESKGLLRDAPEENFVTNFTAQWIDAGEHVYRCSSCRCLYYDKVDTCPFCKTKMSNWGYAQ